jgi:hypothetical protein
MSPHSLFLLPIEAEKLGSNNGLMSGQHGRILSFSASGKGIEMDLPPQEMTREFGPSEKVLWTGQPKQGAVFRAGDLFAVPFSLVWCGIAIFIFVTTLRAPKTPVFFVVFPALFVLIGLYVVFGRFWVEARQRSRTFYAVTNERIVIVSGLFNRTVKSIDLKTLGETSLSERKDGGGSITFGPSSPFDWMLGGMPAWPGVQGRFVSRFDVIADVRSVYAKIRSAQQALAR